MTFELEHQPPKRTPSAVASSVWLAPLRFAYADPPYPGCAKQHYAKDPSGIVAAEVNHAELIERLMTFDSWALSTHTPALRSLLPLCPENARVAAWTKPFCAFKPNVRVAYAWEPVIFWGARPKRDKQQWTARDYVSAMPPIFRKQQIGGTKGQKPLEFCVWLFEVMGLIAADELHDIFPGSGAVTVAWEMWKRQTSLFDGANSVFDQPKLS